jgi:catechol 2,3-dioxygenase-like lactoylglutathione lyase family enzyme
MLDVDTLHHASLPATDIERSKRFYSEVLGLKELPRPPFTFPGAWYQVGAGTLHLIVSEHSTLREGKGIDSHDVHVAIRVKSYRGALAHLAALGYQPLDPGAARQDPFRTMRINAAGTAGFPQIYILDPDRNVIEINADRDDA